MPGTTCILMSMGITCEVRAINEKYSLSLRTFSGLPACAAVAMAPPSAMHILHVTESLQNKLLTLRVS